MSPSQWAALSALVYFAGIVDSLAGGGGLITLPAYLAFGVHPGLVLGTNKLASSIGTVASCVNYHRAKRLDRTGMGPALVAAVAGSWLGARAAARLSPEAIRILLLLALPLLSGFLLTRRGFGSVDESARYPDLKRREAAVSLPIGAYDGFFGPGTGTFFALSLVRLCGYDLVKATARAKLLNLTTNASALAAFAWAGLLDWRVGLSMGAASLAGHYTGSQLGLRGGARFIRPVVAAVCAALFAKLLFDTLAVPARAAADPMALRHELMMELRADPADPVGSVVADYLGLERVSVSVAEAPIRHEGRAAAARYRRAENLIELDPDFAAAAGSDARAMARRLAPTIVHEVEHARLEEAAPGAPAVSEGELAAYAAEAAYLKRRGVPAGAPNDAIAQMHAFTRRAAAGGLEGVRRAFDEAGILSRLPPVKKTCAEAPKAKKPSCFAALKFLRSRLDELKPLLDPS